MNIMTANGPRDLYVPHYVRAAPACQRLAREANDALNRGVEVFNQYVRAAASQGRPLGWFPDMVNRDTGKVTTWGPRPSDTPLAPLYVLPEWARPTQVLGEAS